jgi:hypothetical protein
MSGGSGFSCAELRGDLRGVIRRQWIIGDLSQKISFFVAVLAWWIKMMMFSQALIR